MAAGRQGLRLPVLQFFSRLFSQKMEPQVTNRVMLVKPACFNYNPETAESNKFQTKIDGLSVNSIQSQSLKEFEALATKLEELRISVKVFEDNIQESSDAVFPNNWISFHSENKMVLYPMLSECRRKERNPDITSYWSKALGATIIDCSRHENSGKYLEGTGSMILDRRNRLAYACLSPRTHIDVLNQFCEELKFKPVTFRSVLSPRDDGREQEVYHTNVMMAMGEGFAVVCLESISSPEERRLLESSLAGNNIEVIPISIEQVIIVITFAVWFPVVV